LFCVLLLVLLLAMFPPAVAVLVLLLLLVNVLVTLVLCLVFPPLVLAVPVFVDEAAALDTWALVAVAAPELLPSSHR
jgi:hypothetical protein